MDNTTEQPNTQGETNKLEGSDLRAALGFANNILGQTIPPDEEEQGETGEEAPQEALAPQGGENGEEMDKDHMGEEMTKMESKMDEKLETLRTELKGAIKTEVDSIKDMIKSALDEEE